MQQIIFEIHESPESGFEAKALGYSIYTEGETEEEIKKNIVDAVKCHFDEDKMPDAVLLHFVKDELLAL